MAFSWCISRWCGQLLLLQQRSGGNKMSLLSSQWWYSGVNYRQKVLSEKKMNVVFVIWIWHIRITTRYRHKLIFVRLITAILLSAHFRKVNVNRTFILNVSIRMMSSGPSVWRNHQSFSKCVFYQSLWEGGNDLLQDVKIYCRTSQHKLLQKSLFIVIASNLKMNGTWLHATILHAP